MNSRATLPRVFTALLCALLIACATGGMRPESLPHFDSVEEQFKYGSVGIESEAGVPYWIWQVLPRIFADKLPRPGGYTSFGFVWEPGKELPVGFSKAELYGGPRVAINCAFCHTASVRLRPLDQPKIIAAGPGNQINPQAYVKFLQAVAEDPRFNTGEILSAIAGHDAALVDAADAVSLPLDPRDQECAQTAAPRLRLDVPQPRLGPWPD